jgi:hypothetical protein
MEPNLCGGISMGSATGPERIGEALGVGFSTTQRDLEGLPTVGKPPRPKGGRPKGQTTERIGEALKSSAAPSPSNNRMFGMGIE